MPATRIRIETFLVKIARTREQEASCDDCAKHLARLAEALRQDNTSDGELLDILHHLVMCIPCAEEFQVLRDCARMDAEESWPRLEEMWRWLDSER